MTKKIFLSALLICLFYTRPAFAITENTGVFTIGSTSFLINGQVYSMDVAPYIQSGRTFVPVRYTALALGIPADNISYNNGMVTLIGLNRVVQISVGSNTMLVNGAVINMDVNVPAAGGRTMLPVRWIAAAFGANVSWDESNLTITIESPDSGNAANPVNTCQLQNLSDKTVDPITYTASTSVVSRDCTWKYNNLSYNWHVEIPTQLIDWDRKISGLINTFYDSNGNVQYSILSSEPNQLKQIILSLTTNGNYVPWTTEENNTAYIGSLAQKLSDQARTEGYNYFQTAEFALSFVGGAISYKITDNPQLPAQTLLDNGDCKDKSILLAAILKAMGYKVALLDFPPPPGQSLGHMAVGIEFADTQVPSSGSMFYYPYNGVKYYFAETTEPNWHIGEISDKDLEKTGYVYQVN